MCGAFFLSYLFGDTKSVDGRTRQANEKKTNEKNQNQSSRSQAYIEVLKIRLKAKKSARRTNVLSAEFIYDCNYVVDWTKPVERFFYNYYVKRRNENKTKTREKERIKSKIASFHFLGSLYSQRKLRNIYRNFFGLLMATHQFKWRGRVKETWNRFICFACLTICPCKLKCFFLKCKQRIWLFQNFVLNVCKLFLEMWSHFFYVIGSGFSHMRLEWNPSNFVLIFSQVVNDW